MGQRCCNQPKVQQEDFLGLGEFGEGFSESLAQSEAGKPVEQKAYEAYIDSIPEGEPVPTYADYLNYFTMKQDDRTNLESRVLQILRDRFDDRKIDFSDIVLVDVETDPDTGVEKETQIGANEALLNAGVNYKEVLNRIATEGVKKVLIRMTHAYNKYRWKRGFCSTQGTPNPEAVARKALRSGSSGDSFLGEVGRGIGAGLVGIPQGIATLGSTIIDGVFDTDLTDSLNEYFEEFKPETNSTAGHIAQYLTQFGIPGVGVASALSKAGKTAQILSAGAVDAAVATDDVETLSDLFFDEVSDQDRLAKINGSEAAASRLLERAAVFGETAGIVGALPVALKALATTGKATVDVAGVAAAPLVKAVASSPVTTAVTNRLMPSTGQKFTSVEDAITERSDSFMDVIKDRFTFQGALRSDDIAQLKEAQVQETRRQLAQVEQDFGEVITTVKKAGLRGTLSATDQDNLAKAIGDYYSPLTKLSYRDDAMQILADPDLKRKVAEDIQNKALQVIKSYEGPGNKIDYDSLGIPNNQTISNLLEQQREIVDLNSKAIDDFAKDFDNTFIPEDYGNILKDNYGLYTNRTYKAMIDNNYVIDPEQKAKAITELEELW